jgi:hypothetical protein
MAVTFLSDRFLFGFFIFGLSVCTTSVLSYTSHRQRQHRLGANTLSPTTIPQGRFYRLTCLLEDAPRSAFKGQAYELATPLMTPFACPLEDASPTSLKGQAYELATPLMTPFACVVGQTWREFYLQQLNKPGINYWQWKKDIESNNVCQALSLLLTLPEPQGYAKDVLEVLGARKYPFLNLNLNSKNLGNIWTALSDFMDDGKFAKLDWCVQVKMRQSFKQWHDSASEKVGVKALEAIYRICYGTSWETIQQIVSQDNVALEDFFTNESFSWWQVLGVSDSANATEVEKAYKKLIRLWHPDLNRHPYATQITSQINIAYDRYRASHPIVPLTESISSKNNPYFWKKIREWLKPIFSR